MKITNIKLLILLLTVLMQISGCLKKNTEDVNKDLVIEKPSANSTKLSEGKIKEPNSIKKSSEDNGQYKVLSFKALSGYDFEKRKKIPNGVKSLNGQSIKIGGFMLPIETDETGIKKFLLMANQMMCCFGAEIRLNQWALVEIDEPCGYYPDVIVTVLGKIQVGVQKEGNVVSSLYRIKAAKVIPPEDAVEINLSNVIQ